MKSEKEIRKYLNDVRTVSQIPCDCSREHAVACYLGRLAMESIALALQWVLQELPDMDRSVEEMSKEAADAR